MDTSLPAGGSSCNAPRGDGVAPPSAPCCCRAALGPLFFLFLSFLFVFRLCCPCLTRRLRRCKDAEVCPSPVLRAFEWTCVIIQKGHLLLPDLFVFLVFTMFFLLGALCRCFLSRAAAILRLLGLLASLSSLTCVHRLPLRFRLWSVFDVVRVLLSLLCFSLTSLRVRSFPACSAPFLLLTSRRAMACPVVSLFSPASRGSALRGSPGESLLFPSPRAACVCCALCVQLFFNHYTVPLTRGRRMGGGRGVCSYAESPSSSALSSPSPSTSPSPSALQASSGP